jgi:DNA polymerase-3 subunit epsilon
MFDKKLRQIVLDTETTGLNPEQGHRIIEIGAIELINRRPTKNYFHYYLNPQRLIDNEATTVHGIRNEFLQDKPLFADIVDEFKQFISDSELIIHNASFDVGFINYEYQLLNLPLLETHCTIVDSLALARQKHPAQRNSLDALCKRYQIDNGQREWHGALLDAQLLAEVYLAMTGGQDSLWAEDPTIISSTSEIISPITLKDRAKLTVIFANSEELSQHQQQLSIIQKISKEKCLWLQLDNSEFI